MEREFIEWLRQHVPTHPRASLGLSDDAAIVSLAGRAEIVATTDMLNDGVDFRVGVDDPRRIGRQALGANLSDLAAMAARPLAALVSIALPRSRAGGSDQLQLAIGIYEGILALAVEYDVALAGGDTNTHEGPLVISVTALGEVTDRGPLTRSGGKPGDWLLVTGKLGGSLLGHMFDFTPRVREALVLHNQYELHAGIDISDGLALDASRMAKQSGCGAVIYTDRVPISSDAYELSDRENAADRHVAALAHALSDGQDFELLIAAPQETAQSILRDRAIVCEVTHVGALTDEMGLWQEDERGRRERLEPIGWMHK